MWLCLQTFVTDYICARLSKRTQVQKKIVSKISEGRKEKFLIPDSHSHLHPAKANYSPHGNLAGSSHQKITSVHQAIIPDESALLPLLATHICLSVPLLITIFLQTEPDPAGSACFLRVCGDFWSSVGDTHGHQLGAPEFCRVHGQADVRHTHSLSRHIELQARWALTAEVNLSFRWQNVEFFTALFLLSQLTLYMKTKLMTCKRHSPRLQKKTCLPAYYILNKVLQILLPSTFFVKRWRIKSARNFQFNYRRPQPVALNCPCCY